MDSADIQVSPPGEGNKNDIQGHFKFQVLWLKPGVIYGTFHSFLTVNPYVLLLLFNAKPVLVASIISLDGLRTERREDERLRNVQLRKSKKQSNLNSTSHFLKFKAKKEGWMLPRSFKFILPIWTTCKLVSPPPGSKCRSSSRHSLTPFLSYPCSPTPCNPGSRRSPWT